MDSTERMAPHKDKGKEVHNLRLLREDSPEVQDIPVVRV